MQINGFNIKLQRHTYGKSKKTVYTWAFVCFLDGNTLLMGDPWPVRNPPRAELREALKLTLIRYANQYLTTSI